MSRKTRYLTPTDRVIIEKLLTKGRTLRYIADFLEVHPSTISREVRRGRYDRLDGQTWKTYAAYSSDIGQQWADWHKTAKGRPLKIGNNHTLARYIEEGILAGNSPDVVLARWAQDRGHRPFSTVTLYRYIDMGLFLHISNQDLLEKPHRKRRYRRVHKAAQAPAGRSIESRPFAMTDHGLFGHWEMDCVIGKAIGKKEAILTFTERKTRYEMIFALPAKDAKSVCGVLDSVFSMPDAKKIFRTITVDNGPEFSDFFRMEHSPDGNPRTMVYYCHPYCSAERGTNERMNRMVRRFFPKGKSMAQVTQADCDRAAAWLNHYPRKSLSYATPAALFKAEIEKLKISCENLLQHY